MKKLFLSLVALICATVSNAQIGYQMSLLNTATGEPRANETVSCIIDLKNSEGSVICSETKSATSNDFGVISLTVGNAHTFDNMDWSKLPLYVSVSVGGKFVSQSQVLTVPVAECAKTIAPNEDLLGAWTCHSDRGWTQTIYLGKYGIANVTGTYPEKKESWQYIGNFVNYGDIVFVCTNEANYVLCHINGRLYDMIDKSSGSVYYSR